MNMDWTHFTPWASLSGGLLLGVASALFILLNGRILGISGILGGLLPAKTDDASWRITFLLGLFVSPLVMKALAPSDFFHAPRIDANMTMVVVAGLMVGLGTRYGSGCTSGHGVCGLSRLSPRSMAATGLFMAAGFAIVFVIKHIL
ncbi:YeeE/YedE family protein [Limnohabitans sp.]|uniref:YeeE/YedE family protein n=1 Tax=Limnohabitans sp. TaxID=1907725 RepID=UPI00286F74FC|nr:YeeE/YedE family protein [Limnohabitans sp.]